ncbi:unnamed protein product [Cylicostephanus goldi]|uniref:Uncharacterized protein n=1 Tax=Cylicostephanus goldi TaxID=71465 RepID=A0A3P7MHD2_CYLGO|nr:unnamed protein product [Cylicostephanus goldi]
MSVADELRAEREQLRLSKRKENDLKNFVKVLEQELRDVRASANMSKSTPFNPKLKHLVLDKSPQKRSSLGFNESVDLNDAFINSALRKPPKPVCVREKVSSKVRKPLFDESSDDDGAENTANVSLEYPSSLDKMSSPVVPKTLRDRVLAGSVQSKQNGVGTAHRAAEKALESLELRNITTVSRTVRRPLLKRKNENSLANQRLSQYFAKKQKNDEVIELDD